jgi:VanZ family protein
MTDLCGMGRLRRTASWLWRWGPPLLLMVSIFYLSHQPDLPHAPDPWLDVLLKKLGHAIEFAVLFLLLWRAWRREQVAGQALNWAMVATAAYAISDEWHQSFVPGRKANLYDVLIDASGALLLWWLLRGGRCCGLLRRGDENLAE